MVMKLLTDHSPKIFSAPVTFRHFLYLIVSILALAFARGVGAESIELQWDPVIDDTLVIGYELHYGVESGQYQWVIDADTYGAATDTQLVENLVAGNTYYFAVRSRNYDASLVSGFSNEVSVTIAPSDTTSDTIPPTVSISTTPDVPTYTSAQTVTISADASDNVGVTRVEFYDGTTLKGTDTIAPYSYAWSISSAYNGTHDWTARAYDAVGNVGTSNVLIRTVDIPYDPLAGLTAAYGMDETEGTIVTDASGNGNDGLIVGATRTADGRFGGAVSFDGIDDRLDLNTLDITGGDGLTISVWMKADDFGIYDARLISKATGVNESDHYWMISTFDNNSVRFRLKAGGSTTTLVSKGGVITTGQWHHVVATYDGLRMHLYVDGAEVGSIAKTGVIDTNASVPAAIGNQPQGTRPFDGLIDEVRLYAHSLSAEEIQADMDVPISALIDSSDTTPPTVSISTTPDGPMYTSTQTVTIDADASDNVGVTRVDFYDGTTLKGSDTTAPYSYAWAIGSADNGTHDWTAKAYDAAGNVSTSSVLSRTVSIILPDTDTTHPTVSISTIPEGPIYTSAQTVTISADASDNVGVIRVEFYEGTTLKGTDTTAPYSYAWSINRADNGIYSWTARAYDAADNVSTTSVLSRTVRITGDGRVATYDFDEAEGAIVTDVSGNGNDGLIADATRSTDGRIGSAVSFDGVDDWIDLDALDIAGGDGLTISVWIKADDFETYDARLVSKATGVYDEDHYWMVSTFKKNSVRFRLKAGGSTTTLISDSGVITAGQWHHVTATYDGQLMRLYVDGVEVGSIAKTGVIDTNASVPVAIGNQPQGARPFDGLIDEVHFYNHALTTEEIHADMTPDDDGSISSVAKVDFSASPTSGIAPLTVVFTDLSSYVGSVSGDSTEQLWDFGNGDSSGGQTAVYTYTKGGAYTVSLAVTGPGGSATETKANYITVSVPPVADFSANAISGTAPLAVDFTDTSSGVVTEWTWDFGDGTGASTAQNPQHIYSEPGTYTVTLAASGPGGADSEIKPGYISVSVGSDSGNDGGVDDDPQYPKLEVGEVEVDYQWRWIAFKKTFGKPPVVIAKSLSAYDETPATVRIRNIDSTRFEVRVQEWDYLNDMHGYETVSYLAMESGSWELEDGTRIEANRLETNATTVWESVNFARPFDIAPVVLAAVTTHNGSDAVTTRLREIDASQFQVRMQEQEANPRSHVFETISYIAWEPSSGTVEGVPFEVGATLDKVRHDPYAISYQRAFTAPPVFLADMQTTDGGDTANVRWRDNTDSGVEVWVQEEQSKDSEMRHTTETIGTLSFGR